MRLLAHRHRPELALYLHGLEAATSLADMTRWLGVLHSREWATDVFGPSAGACALPEDAETLRRHVRKVMSEAGVLPPVRKSTFDVQDPRGGEHAPRQVSVFHIDLYDVVGMMLRDTELFNVATLVVPQSPTADPSHPACSMLDRWRHAHIVELFSADAAGLHAAGAATTPKALVLGLELGADGTGDGLEPMYVRLLGTPAAALYDQRACHLFALADYPDPPAGLSSAEEALFRINCVQAVLRGAVIEGLQVRMGAPARAPPPHGMPLPARAPSRLSSR